MKKHLTLLPRMAVSNIRKNGSSYFPYIGVSAFAMFTYFVFDLILKNDIMYTLPKGVYAVMLVSIGFGLLTIIMIPFLYYTNSFLIKRRKRELGLYSILGMEKKHIGIMMFWESIVVYFIVMAAAIIMGLLFSRLIFLILLNLVKMPVDVEFVISPRALTDTLIFYAFITGLNLLVNLVQVGKSNPVELMSDSRRGEKEPKRVCLWSIVGLAAMVTGYRMAILSRLDSYIFGNFFLAVFLVVIGTYLLFTSGSIGVLRILKKNRKFYYQPENFVTVSGMIYRMKKSAASLSNICIFSTMVVITVVCTVAVYLGMESIVTSSFSRVFEVYFFGREHGDMGTLKQETAKLAETNGITLTDELHYSYVKIRAYREDEAFKIQGESYNYNRWSDLILMTQEEYNLLEGKEERLEPGEVLVFSDGADYGKERIRFEEQEYSIQRELTESSVLKKRINNVMGIDYVVVFANREQLNQVSSAFGVDGYEGISYFYGFQAEGSQEDVDDFSGQLKQYMSMQKGFARYDDNRSLMSDMESMYGGLLFIGIFFGAIFLICLLIIMYYKQITEGFEDQKNFEIMQKVGMNDTEIRRTIKRQISMVFGIPLLGALCHTAVGMNMVYMLLGAIGFFEVRLLIACSIGGCLIFAIVYGLSFKRTSMAYYRIVKRLN